MLMPAKILISTFTFPPNKDGVAEAARAMAVGLAERGHEVVVTTGHLAERTDFQPHPRVRVEAFEVVSHWKFEGRSQEEKQRMQRLIVAERPDVIICHCWEIWSTAFAEEVFKQLPATRKILVSHGYTTHRWRPNLRPPFFGLGVLWRSLPKVLGLPWTLRRYDRVVFLSNRRDWDRFFDHRVARLTRYPGIRVIPNGTEQDPPRGAVDAFKERFALGDGFAALCVANFGPRKNQALAVRAFRRARIPGSVLVLIGSEFNDYARETMELDAQLRVTCPEGRVVFIEKLERPATLAAYAACDVFLLAATAETQPIALLENMAAGKPFVSTDTGCVRELPGGIVARREADLAKALATLAADPAKRHALGQLARQAVLGQYGQNKVLDAQETMILELLGGAR